MTKYVWLIIFFSAAIGCATNEEESVYLDEGYEERATEIDVEVEPLYVEEDTQSTNIGGDVVEEDVDFSQFPDVQEKLDAGGGIIDTSDQHLGEECEGCTEHSIDPVVDVPQERPFMGYATTTKDCNVRKDTGTNSAILNKLKAGKKLWVEPADNFWRTVYTKQGPAYMHRSCFE